MKEDKLKKVVERISTSRRRLLKKATALATLAVSSTMVSNRVQASAQESCERSDTKDLSYLPSPKQVQATEGVLPLSGGAGLYYWDTGGEGPAVVLSHPGRGSALTWPYQQPVLSAAGFRVIAYSRRGYYGSPAGLAADTGNYADDLNALITHLNIDKFHILGLAAGGFAVSDYAVSYPEKLLSMVIVCSLFGLWDKNIDERLDFILPKSFAGLPPEFKELGASYRWANPEGVRQWIDMEEKSRGNGERHGQQAKSNITWEKMRAGNIPTFFIAGGADLYQPPSMMRAAAREIPNSQTLVVAEAGHAVQWEQPALFNQAVIAFFRKHQ
ncbi:alpha/beta hydrolase [Colwellia sp. MB3u-28]|nr:alpha/beta hydrolase [Colwellia sp. MB02u-7]MBA6236778.1 alpha/beta hydrolase [Colwellia sp. MB02u-11]MBA6255970.1 alpha/beta hydrolase [Colwellia sp. MB3u-28]MBA6259139.1 alpha/beta hydrolase [Colwellia sp. MB3u-41]MBA6299187.1 alpha/beta hydrolase [Colwellia sp. MB3u-22]MBA6310436.1 alpha/beta hydrolase [Colwellia sp. MB3u-64]